MTVSNIVDELVALVDKRCEEMNSSDRADFLAILTEDVAERADAAYDELDAGQDDEVNDRDDEDDRIAASRIANLRNYGRWDEVD